MKTLKVCKDGKVNRVEFNRIKDMEEVQELLKDKKEIDKYIFIQKLFSEVIKSYNKLKISISTEIKDQENILDNLIGYMHSMKQYEDIINTKLNKFFENKSYEINKIIENIHESKEYNLFYNLRNYNEHFGKGVYKTTVTKDKIEIFASIEKLKELDNRRWKRKLDQQFPNNEKIEIIQFINIVLEYIIRFNEEVFKFLLYHDYELAERCIRLYQFYQRYNDDENREYKIYFANSINDNNSIINLNELDERFIYHLIRKIPIQVVYEEMKLGECCILGNQCIFECISSIKQYIENKIETKSYCVPKCLKYSDKINMKKFCYKK